MTVKNLGNTPFETIVSCFLQAFEHYFVEMPTAPDYYRERWRVAKVRYELSYGMFDDDKLVGFIIHGIDRRHGDLIAFNSGTGVLPAHRGKRVVKSIYDHALPELRKNGITKSALEVIQANAIAVKAYESVGFSICKHYKCFSGEIVAEAQHDINLKEMHHDDLDWNRLPEQEYQCWDHHKNSIQTGNYRYFQVLENGLPASYFIINPTNGYIAQLGCLNGNESSWTSLFSAIKSVSPNVKINNVDDRLHIKLKHIEAAGLENTIDQYEMEMKL